MCYGRAPSVPPSPGKAICLVARRGAAGRYGPSPAPEAGRAHRGRPFLPHPRQACGAGEGGAPLPPGEDEAVEKRRPAAVGVRPGAPAPSAGAITRSRARPSRTPAGHYLAAPRARGAPAPGRASSKQPKAPGGAEWTQSARWRTRGPNLRLPGAAGRQRRKSRPSPRPRMGRYHPRRVAVRGA